MKKGLLISLNNAPTRCSLTS